MVLSRALLMRQVCDGRIEKSACMKVLLVHVADGEVGGELYKEEIWELVAQHWTISPLLRMNGKV